MIHSLRSKFLIIFLLAIVIFAVIFYFLWLPRYYHMENIHYTNETKGKFELLKLSVEQTFNNHKEFDNSKQSLFNKIIRSQLELNEDWIEITIHIPNGEMYFQKRKKSNDILESFRADIFSFGKVAGVLELKVAPAIYIKVEESHMKEIFLFGITLLTGILGFILLIQEFLIIKPLARLTFATKEISQGNFSFKLPASNRDEIGDLSVSFVQMRASLVETQEKLKEEIILAKDIAEAFSSSEEKISTIIQNIADGLVIVNEKGFIEMFNPTFYKMLGYADIDLKGKNISSIVIDNHVKQHDSYITSCLNGKRAKLVNQGIREVKAVTKNGHEIPIEITINDYTVNNKRHFVALLRDISYRKEAERKLKAERDKAKLFLDTAQVAILSLDRSGNINLANQKAYEIFGFAEPEMQCKNWFDLISEKEIRDALEENYFLHMKQQDEIPDYFIVKMQNKNNQEKILEWHNKVLIDKNGKPAGMIISGMDVTDNYYADIENNKLRKQLLQSQKMEAIGQLTGGIAHDFNNILAGMMGYTEMLIERENDDPDKRKIEYLNLIYESGERATDLIQNMLSYSRGISAVKKQSLYLPGMTKDVLKMLSSVIPSSVEIKTDFENKSPDIACDSISIQQVIMNLCINARDAMNNKGQITLSIKNNEQASAVCCSCGEAFIGHYVTLAVSDNGSGISKENIEHLFEPFFSTKEVGKGSGMGLSVIHGILHEVGAHIVVKSEIGEGSSFIAYFPLADVTQEIQVA